MKYCAYSIFCTAGGTIVLLSVLFFGSINIPTAPQFHDTYLYSYSAASFNRLCPGRSQWYGTSAYPTIDGRNESWRWLLAFVRSVESASSDDVAAWKRFIEWTTDNDSLTLDSVRFSEIPLSSFEKAEHERPRGARVRVWDMDRTECFTKLCDKRSHSKDSLWKSHPNITGDVVFLNFRDVDVYDIEQVIKKLSRTIYIAISCIAEFPVALHEEDIGLGLYNMLNKMYFEWEWVPILSDIDQCSNIASGSCHFWMIWKRWNKRSRVPFIPPAGPGTTEYEVQRISAFVTRPHADACSRKRRIGGQWQTYGFVDGQWTICLDHLEKIVASGNCLVYSFGIADDWSFDDAMHEIGCRVYSFDPSINTASYQRNKSHWFYDWGIGTGTERSSQWTLRSFDDVRRRLGHENQTVTILKMDVESAEWTFLSSSNFSINLADIDQFVFEIHTEPGDVRLRSQLLHAIEKNGFVLFNSRLNPVGLDLRAYSHTKSLMNSPSIMAELSFMRCNSQ